MSGAWLAARGLGKRYGGVVALDGVSLELRAGEVRGLIGANGAGKSTLVKILAGEVAADAGEVQVDGEPVRLAHGGGARRAGIVMVPQELTVVPHLTVAENVMLGRTPRTRLGFVRPRRLRWEATEALDFLGLRLPLDVAVGKLPLISQRLVMAARAIAADARLLMFDEPTAAMSPVEVQIVLDVLRALAERGVSTLYVSHRLDEIVSICDAVTAVRDGRVVADLDAAEATRERLAELIAPRDDAADRSRASRRGAACPDAPPALDVQDLHTRGVRGVSLSVQPGEIVGVAGLVGSGVPELLLAVAGAARRRGAVLVGGRPLPPADRVAAVAAGVGFVAGDRTLGVLARHSIRENVSLPSAPRLARLGFMRRRLERQLVEHHVGRVALTAPPEAPIASLSGGNQQKALVARWIAAGVRVLLLDDPTAGVDVAARAAIHDEIRMLRDEGVAVLVVSTDHDELAELSDRVVILERGTVASELTAGEIGPTRILLEMTGGAGEQPFAEHPPERRSLA